MPILLEDKPAQTPYYKRQIRCPGHWLVHPGVDIYEREPFLVNKNCSDFVELKGKRYNIRKTKIALDRFGRKKIDWKKLYELRDKGVVISPKVSAAWAIENVYDPSGYLCTHCPKYCKEGQGRIITTTIKRLMGIPMKRK
jgi:hypothetical protein